MAEACGVELPALEDQQREVLTWDQIREMSAGGVAVGAHTHSHRVLATLSQEEQEEELAASKEVLEAQLGTQVQTLAYPVGGEAHINESTTALARRLGYRAAFTYLTGHNVWGSMDPYRVRRTEGPSRVDLMAGLTTLPRLFNTIQ